MAFTQDLVTSRNNYADGNTRIGKKDRMWYDSITNTLRIGDGVTPGGIVVTAGGMAGGGISNITDNGDGTLTLTYGEGETFVTGDLTGPTGATGATGAKGDTGDPGVGISNIADNGDGTLTLTYASGSTTTTSNLRGPQGNQGNQGDKGDKGDKGDTGERGNNGNDGDSAYDIAVTEGFSGTVAEWLASLVGATGSTGATGPAGADGADGAGITNITDNGDGTLTLTYGSGSTVITSDLTGPQGEQGIQGIQGIQGETGATGAPGANGTDGIDGIGISSVQVSEAGNLLITLSDASIIDAGNVKSGVTGSITDPYSWSIAADDSTLIEINSGESVKFIGASGISTTSDAEGNITITGPNLTNYVTLDGEQTLSNKTFTFSDGTTQTTAFTGTGSITFTGNSISSDDSSAIDIVPVVNLQSDVYVGGDLFPNTDLGGNLGSQERQWKSLYVSNNTIFIGGFSVSVVGGKISVSDPSNPETPPSSLATESFVQQAVNELIGAAPEALNTLQELAAALGNDENFATTILDAVSASTNAVRYDINNQGLTAQQKQNARTNIDAVSDADVYAAAIVMG